MEAPERIIKASPVEFHVALSFRNLAMLYMVIEYFNAGAAPEIYRRARETGRQLPAGLEYVNSWVDLDYFRCFQLMRTEDRSLFDEWIAAWGDLAHFEIIPVRTSVEASRHIADHR
jgi:hypothetical protein